jgi:subtilisin-like proprotein convertase family protein
MTQKLLFRCAHLLLPVAFASAAFAQVEFLITQGSGTGCSGVIQDSGGPAGDYSDNENYTFTICPDVPGNVIYLTWLIADLSTAGTNDDNITIYDGDNTSATSLGTYSGTALQGGLVYGTVLNTTGCLTIVFQSNGTGVGNFSASFQCTTPCLFPTAVATMNEPVPLLACQNEVISFDGSGSTAQAGFNLVEYMWDFDDGTTDNFSGPLVQHSYPDAGEYVVQLYVTDDNGCGNLNLVDLQILVSTTASFQGTMESVETCLGAIVDLTALVTPITWTGIPEANFGDGVFLPDNSIGMPFTSTLTFTQFEPGQTITDCNTDILSVCVEMEHSYMGDLLLQVICPNGQTLTLHQQGGANTYLGSPYDLDSDVNPIQGDCWTYCWSPTATNGTWADNSITGTNNTQPSGFDNPGQGLIPGTYEPVGSFCDLLGCPLNGDWTFQSTDLFLIDNGFICSWEINFNPAIIPDVTQFTPDFGLTDPDSAWWSGPALTLDPNNPLIAQATPSSAGAFNYTFTVIDNFGCTYDTTIVVTVAPLMEIDAGPDIILCNDSVPMAGVVVANGPPTNCVWMLQLNETFGDTWNGGATLAVTIDGVTNNYAILTAGTLSQIIPLNVSTGQTITLTYTAGTLWNNENSFTLTNDMGAVVYASGQGPVTGVAYSGVIVCGGGTSPLAWVWTPSAGLGDDTDPTTNVYTTQSTMYYLSAYPVGSPECAVMDSVLVAPDPSIDAGISNAVTICASEAAFFMNDSLLGTPDPGGEWTSSLGAVVDDQFDPTWETSEIFTYTVTSPAGCQATAQLDVTVIPADDPACCGVVTMGPGSISCNLLNGLTVDPGNTGVGVWSGPAGAVFADPNSTATAVTMPAGSGGTHWFYWIEDDGAFCYLIDSVELTFTDTILIDFTPTDAICYTYCDGTAGATVTGGNITTDFMFTWSTGEAGVGLNNVANLCAGSYTLTATDDNGCIGENEVLINEPPQLVIDSIAARPVTCSGYCDGEVEVYDPQAVLYSFDDGQNWQPEPLLTGACEQYYPIRIQDAAGCLAAG